MDRETLTAARAIPRTGGWHIHLHRALCIFPPREKQVNVIKGSRAPRLLLVGPSEPCNQPVSLLQRTQNTSTFLFERRKSNHQSPNIKALPRSMRITHTTNPSNRPKYGTHPWLDQEMIRRRGQSNWDGEGRPNPSLRFAPHMPGQSKWSIYRNVHPFPYFVSPQ